VEKGRIHGQAGEHGVTLAKTPIEEKNERGKLGKGKNSASLRRGPGRGKKQQVET